MSEAPAIGRAHGNGDRFGLMTVPGKGGRPRKWSSDTERVRAYRARQRGEPEPPPLADVLGGTGELADALARERRLLEQLAEATESMRRARAETTNLERRLQREREQFGWIAAENARLRDDYDAVRNLKAELGEARRLLADERLHAGWLMRENTRLRDELRAARTAGEPPCAPADRERRPNRAERRRAGRRR